MSNDGELQTSCAADVQMTAKRTAAPTRRRAVRKPEPATPQDAVAKAIRYTLMSPNECDSNWEPANVVDGLFAIARALHDLAEAVRQREGE